MIYTMSLKVTYEKGWIKNEWKKYKVINKMDKLMDGKSEKRKDIIKQYKDYIIKHL